MTKEKETKDFDLTESINKVVDRACRDELFALQLKSAALDASRGGIDSKEFRIFMEYFADTEEELRLLTTPNDADDPHPTTTSTTLATILTISTAACTTTTTGTTTTTLSNFCP